MSIEATSQDLEYLRRAAAGEVIGDGLLQIRLLVGRLAEVRSAMELIVEAEGQDSGVILLSDASPTHYDAELKCHVYDHEHFSQLGDALVAVSRLASLPG